MTEIPEFSGSIGVQRKPYVADSGLWSQYSTRPYFNSQLLSARQRCACLCCLLFETNYFYFIFLFFSLATKNIAETSYYLATNSLHLSTLCLQYKPTVVACICIYFVCKWSNFLVSLLYFFFVFIKFLLLFRSPNRTKGKNGGHTLTIL